MAYDISAIKEDLGFLFNPTKKSIDDFIKKTSPQLTKLNYSFDNRVVGGEDTNGQHYMVVARFRNTYVNKDLVKEYETEFSKDYAEFPKWGALCIHRGNPKQLYFGVFYENCSPNWNHESIVVKLIPIEEVNQPFITDWKGLDWVRDSIAETLYMTKQKCIGKELPNYGQKPSKLQLKHLIELGMNCTYRKGWAYRGAKAIPITKEQALDKLITYSYELGFYMLDYSVKDNVPTLEFNELSVFDLE